MTSEIGSRPSASNRRPVVTITDSDGTGTRPGVTTTRRGVLAALAVGGAGALAGCLGGDEAAPDPVTLRGSEKSCDNCNMVVEQHQGPKAQAFYLDDAPTDTIGDREDGGAFFCSTWCCYTFVFRHEGRGHDPAGMYGTDYSSVEYELLDDGPGTLVSAHLDAGSFVDLTTLTFVVDSEVQGAMGPSLVGFSEADDAEAFAGEHGGDVLEHGEITAELVSALGP